MVKLKSTYLAQVYYVKSILKYLREIAHFCKNLYNNKS